MEGGKMRALIFPEPWHVNLLHVDIPNPKHDEVLAKIEAVGICGSDVGIFEGDHWIVADGPGGHGHETGAIAIEVGKDVEGIYEGDHLARMGAGYAEYSTHVNVVGHGKDEKELKLPIVRNDMTVEEISFADAVGCAYNCYKRAELERIEGEKKAVILGLGPIGLILTQILRNNGIEVAASDPYIHKRTLAKKWGAKIFDPNQFKRANHGNYTVVNQIKEVFGEVHAVFEMVGKNETLLQAIDLVESGYRVMVFGAQKMQYIPYVNCRKKGVELVYPEAMVNSKDNEDYWLPALDIIAGTNGYKKLDTESLITKRITLEEAVNAFIYYDRERWIKIIVEPHRK
ncbi:MAG: zinc-binding dehydrogenase [Candidatus Lokiarchaeota archaeon]|nr:zinc-binding dehydrogenase [Candidatus Lokiarchaeota archaeon]